MTYIDPEDRPAPSFDPLGSPPKKTRGGGGLAIAAALVVIFGVGVWYAYSQGVQKGGSLVPPLIKADSGPVKVTPENPGGMQVPNQDKQIYESIAGAPRQPQAERLLPPPEQPKPEPPRAVAAAPAVAPQDVAPAAGTPKMPATPRTPVASQPVAAPTQAAPAAAPKASAETPKPAAPPTQTASVPTQTTAAPAQPVAAPPPPAAPPKAVSAAPPPQAADGKYRIQLGSLSDRAAADAEWNRLSRTFADILGAMPHAIERADLANLGTRFRVLAGSFPDRAAALSVCDRLKAKAPTQGCIVAAR